MLLLFSKVRVRRRGEVQVHEQYGRRIHGDLQLLAALSCDQQQSLCMVFFTKIVKNLKY
jgi:hypothetical protein